MLGGSEPAQFDRTIERGEEVILPKTVLGHCFRATSTDYVTFDLGFDVAATREGVTSEVVGLRADGPAAKAGVKPGDIVEADYRDGHPEVLAKLTVKRGGQTLHLSYEPRGARHPGPTWTRVTTPADDKCEDSF
jgi:predicted metalloprotease with PDZ domain